MEEEQRHHQTQQHHHYGGGGSSANTPAMSDLRQFFSPIPTHHQFPPPQSLFSPPTAAAFPHHYDTMMLVAAHGIHDFRSDNSAAVTTALAPASSVAGASAGGFDMDNAAGGGGGGSGGFGLGVGGGDGGATARWPRQETLTLLEIRSRLDHKFKEANHKGPLWDEVSRIMSAEHGYERSGKKCREKFENLYKYYKKTKEGKAGRQDGKHYRFFRQLEALYGEATHHPNPISIHTHHLNMINHHNANATTTAAAATAQFHSTSGHQEGNFQSISLSHTSSDFDTSSSEGNDADILGSTEINGDSSMDMAGRSRKRRGSGRSWKANIKEFIDLQMRRIMEKQEAWLEKMMRSLESKEKERMAREEDWRKKEAMRMEREHRFWAKERAWIEARDKALMDALQRITGKEVGNVVENDNPSQHGQQVEEEEEGNNEDVGDDRWEESEIIKLVELRSSIQARFDERGGGLEEKDLWEEISTRMGCLGHDRSPKMCKDKWNFISKELSNKRKSHQYQHHHHHPQTTNLLYNYGHHEMNEQEGMGLGPPQLGLTRGGGGGGGVRNPMNDSCLRILLGDGGETHPWESYGVKLNKGDHAH